MSLLSLCCFVNKANLRDLIAATGLVFLLKLDSNRPFFAHVTLEIWWMTPKSRHIFYATSSFVYYFRSISKFKLDLQSGNAQFGSNLTIFFSLVTLQFDIWPWKTIGHLFYATSSFVHHFVAIGEFKLELQSGNTQFGSKSTIFLAVWPCNLTYPSMSRGALGRVEVRTSQHLIYAKRTSLHPSAPPVLSRFWGAGRCAPPSTSWT